jgi:hypothetical protein
MHRRNSWSLQFRIRELPPKTRGEVGRCQHVKEKGEPLGRKGLVAILLRKIAARPCNLDRSGNPFLPLRGKKDWSSGTRRVFHTPVFGAKRQKCAHGFLNLLIV